MGMVKKNSEKMLHKNVVRVNFHYPHDHHLRCTFLNRNIRQNAEFCKSRRCAKKAHKLTPGALSFCENWPARPNHLQRKCNSLKEHLHDIIPRILLGEYISSSTLPKGQFFYVITLDQHVIHRRTRVINVKSQ